MRRTKTLKTIEAAMESMLRGYGYEGMARYAGNEIEIGVHLDAGVTMKLGFPETVAPTKAVTEMVKVLDKLNGKKR